MGDDPDIKYGESRALTKGEIELAKTVFGNSVDYSKVRLYHRHYPILGIGHDDNTAVTPDGNMYYPTAIYENDFSKGNRGLFMHEMTHVWQKQHGRDPQLEGIGLGISSFGNYASAYEFKLDPKKDFKDYNIEQQGRLIERYFSYKERQTNPEVFTPTDYAALEKHPFVAPNLLKFEALNRMGFAKKFVQDALNTGTITLDKDGHAHLVPQSIETQRRAWENSQRKQAEEDQQLLAVMKEFIRDPNYASCPIELPNKQDSTLVTTGPKTRGMG
jgi:hypothetical protein